MDLLSVLSIPLLFQFPDKLIPGKGGQDSGVHILPDGCFPGGLSVLFGKPLDIGTCHLFGFLGINYGKVILPAQFIGNPPHLGDVSLGVAAVLFAIHHGNRVPDNVVVQMSGVQVGGNHCLEPPIQ